MTNQTLGIHFGALSDKLSKQLKQQGFKYKKETVSGFEKEIDAYLRLRINGLLTDKMADHILKRLHARIEKHVMKENNLQKAMKANK